MNKNTFKRKLIQLSRDIDKHPHKDELLNIMQQQLADDTVSVNTKF